MVLVVKEMEKKEAKTCKIWHIMNSGQLLQLLAESHYWFILALQKDD